MKKLLKGFVDLIYGTARVRKEYERTHPEDKVLAADASKGIVTKQEEGIARRAKWVTSQRAVILLTTTKIVCGKWIIPLQEIQSAQLLSFRSLFGGGVVLKLQTKDDIHYQFGMSFNPEWLHQESIPLSYETAKVKQSPFSLAVRLIAITYLLYWFYQNFLVH